MKMLHIIYGNNYKHIPIINNHLATFIKPEKHKTPEIQKSAVKTIINFALATKTRDTVVYTNSPIIFKEFQRYEKKYNIEENIQYYLM